MSRDEIMIAAALIAAAGILGIVVMLAVKAISQVAIHSTKRGRPGYSRWRG